MLDIYSSEKDLYLLVYFYLLVYIYLFEPSGKELLLAIARGKELMFVRHRQLSNQKVVYKLVVVKGIMLWIDCAFWKWSRKHSQGKTKY